ncbi:hypothetical protein B9Z55_001817 [Caenorhabditis nigoni]|nr:hypothetical protein B9Z55_001817 [Caenorhabditis nigoni]
MPEIQNEGERVLEGERNYIVSTSCSNLPHLPTVQLPQSKSINARSNPVNVPRSKASQCPKSMHPSQAIPSQLTSTQSSHPEVTKKSTQPRSPLVHLSTTITKVIDLQVIRRRRECRDDQRTKGPGAEFYFCNGAKEKYNVKTDGIKGNDQPKR